MDNIAILLLFRFVFIAMQWDERKRETLNGFERIMLEKLLKDFH